MAEFWDVPQQGAYRIGDLLDPLPQLLFDPTFLRAEYSLGPGGRLIWPAVMAAGFVAVEFPTWLWIAPVMTPDLYKEPGQLESLMSRAREGEEIPGWFYLPPCHGVSGEALAYLQFVTPVPRSMLQELEIGQIATLSFPVRAALRVAIERALLMG